jgi:endonuclease/exonuclease/phosphatase (EEP) superfamily protein YafD
VLALTAAAGCAFTAGGFLDGRTFPGELLALFRLQYFGAALVLAAVCAIAGRRRIGLVAVALAAVNALGLLPGVLTGSRPDPARPQLRLLVANVWYPGNDYRPLLELVERERPDLIGLTELTRDWAAGISSGLQDYPHRVFQAQPGGYGIGLYSRLPLRNARIVYPVRSWPAVARATVAVRGMDIELFVVHSPSAIRRVAAERHRDFMRSLGTLARNAGGSALLCGDSTPLPGPVRTGSCASSGGSSVTTRGARSSGTFPVWNRLLRVPIDQCLAGPGVAVATRVGPAIGSDHFPLLVEAASAS